MTSGKLENLRIGPADAQKSQPSVILFTDFILVTENYSLCVLVIVAVIVGGARNQRDSAVIVSRPIKC